MGVLEWKYREKNIIFLTVKEELVLVFFKSIIISDQWCLYFMGYI